MLKHLERLGRLYIFTKYRTQKHFNKQIVISPMCGNRVQNKQCKKSFKMWATT